VDAAECLVPRNHNRIQCGNYRLFNPAAEVLPGRIGRWFSAAPARIKRNPAWACWREVSNLNVDPTGPVHALHRVVDHINDGGVMSPRIKTGGSQVMIAQSDRGIEMKALHRAILTQPR
jgi:hypothetical protein